MSEILAQLEKLGGSGKFAVGSVVVPSSGTVTITDIGFEPQYFIAYAYKDSTTYQLSLDDYTNNNHVVAWLQTGSPNLAISSRVASKSPQSVTYNTVSSIYSGQTLYYYAIG